MTRVFNTSAVVYRMIDANDPSIIYNSKGITGRRNGKISDKYPFAQLKVGECFVMVETQKVHLIPKHNACLYPRRFKSYTAIRNGREVRVVERIK